MSTAVLRVKRRREEYPQDALVLLCKRIKTDKEEITPSLFVFRGTVDNQETVQVKNIVPKNNLKFKSTHHVDNIINKIRKERKDVSSESRYEIVNCSRGVKDSEEENDGQFDLVDLQLKEAEEQENVQYAYDLYTAPKQDFDIDMLEQLISIENYETDLLFNAYGSSSDEGSDDDSNDENNWRNDYPDTEHSSIDEDDMAKAIGRCNVEDELSSDTDEDKIFDHSSQFNEEVKRYGKAYAMYKARVLSDEPDLSNLIHCSRMKDMDEESIEGYKDDSDDGFYYGQDEDSEQYREQYRHDSSDYDPD